MPANKLWGIGRRIEVRLYTLGIKTIGELANSNERLLKKEFGINGVIFRKLARGEDTSEINRKEKREKSLNHFHTLSKEIYKPEDIKNEIRRIGEYICRKLRSKNLTAGYLHLSIRFESLTYTSHVVKLPFHTNDDREIFYAAMAVYDKLHKPSEETKARQFGMGVYDLHLDTHECNLNLFEKKIFLPYDALDKLKTKYGERVIRVGLET